MLKITLHDSAREFRLKLEGRLSGPWSPRQLRAATRISAGTHRKGTTELARGEDAPRQGQDFAHLQRVPDPARHPAADLRIPPRQSLGAGMGDRPIPGLD